MQEVYDFIDHESMDAGKMFRISGGEPLVMKYPPFKKIMEHAKLRGIFRSIATNMSLPDRMEKILLEDDIEYLAGDFKAPPRYWERVTGMPGKVIENVMQSWKTWGEFSDKTPAECRIMVFPFTTWDDVTWIIKHLNTAPIIVLRGFRRVDWLELESTTPKHIFQIAKKVNQEDRIPTLVRMKWNKGTYLVKNEEITEA
jgi:pyruvate-formate lyase-activating enzyme